MTTDAERIDLLTVDGREGFALVQPQHGRVRVLLSIRSDGEYDLLLSRDDARRLAEALSRASEVIR